MSQESKIDPAIVKKTQDTLGRLIQAPSLTDKLLNRPPVQFIQDIVKSVIKNTGFMKGLYSQEELEASFIKSSKENKILFLNKLIIAVGVAVGEQPSAKANKIAAGVEAEKTNELFQSLAKAINIKPDNDELIKKTLKKLKALDSSDDKHEREEKKEKSRDKNRDEEKESRDRAKSKTEESSKSKDRERKDRDRDREKDRERRDRDKDRDKEREKDRDRKERDKDREKDKERERDRERRERGDKDKERDRERHKEKDRKERDHERERDGSRDRHRDKDKEREKQKEREKEREREKESRKNEERSRHRKDSNDENHKENGRPERAEEELSSRRNDEESEESTNRRRPSSARGPRVQIERDENYALKSQGETFEDNRNFARPTTARPGAPRPKLNNESNETPVKVGSAAKKSTVIVHDDSDSDADFVVKENKFQEEDGKNWKGLDDFKKPGDEVEDEKHGALVTKILESKGKLEHGNELHKSTDQQKPNLQMDLQRKKERERTQKEIDKLKDSIQTLTKASIPLGRTLDFLQEDIDMMQKEIIKWSDEYDNNVRVLKRQKAEMQNFIEPYKEALRQIENQITEQIDRIGTVKRNILLNEEKTSRLIFNIGKS